MANALLERVFTEDYDANSNPAFALAAWRRSYALALMALASTEDGRIAAFADADELARFALAMGVPGAALDAAGYQLRRAWNQPA
jgi:hypothetical protein